MFYVNGFLGAAFYGPQSRVMDGCLGARQLPADHHAVDGVQVRHGADRRCSSPSLYPREQFAVVFGLIWLSYIATDALRRDLRLAVRQAEHQGVGRGRRQPQVGRRRRRRLCRRARGQPGADRRNGLLIGPWIGLAFVIALSNSSSSSYSPRGTDDFTMATTNALLCLAFGAWVL